jgi:hypothetical protein
MRAVPTSVAPSERHSCRAAPFPEHWLGPNAVATSTHCSCVRVEIGAAGAARAWVASYMQHTRRRLPGCLLCAGAPPLPRVWALSPAAAPGRPG